MKLSVRWLLTAEEEVYLHAFEGGLGIGEIAQAHNVSPDRVLAVLNLLLNHKEEGRQFKEAAGG